MAIVEPIAAGESLALGDEGEQVAELQRRLHHLTYYHGDVDARYGDTTETAMREFQRMSGLTEDGRTEAETWGVLEQESQHAGYDPYAQQDDANQDQTVDNEALEPSHLSEDGQWQWNGTQWQAVRGQPQGLPGSDAERSAPLEVSAENQAGTATVAQGGAPFESAASENTSERAPVNVSEFPDVQEGDSGEWVEYLDAMLRSTGF